MSSNDFANMFQTAPAATTATTAAPATAPQPSPEPDDDEHYRSIQSTWLSRVYPSAVVVTQTFEDIHPGHIFLHAQPIAGGKINVLYHSTQHVRTIPASHTRPLTAADRDHLSTLGITTTKGE